MDIISFIAGMVVMAIIWYIFKHFIEPSGTLYIDRSNPEKMIYKFDIEHVDFLWKKSIIILKVKRDDELSQK